MLIPQNHNQRFYEIDILRGIAVILMIIYHFFFNLEYFNIFPMPSFLWPQLYYGGITIMFVIIAGISLSLATFKINDSEIIIKKFITRGVKLFFIGLVITIVTWIYPHDGFIFFGVLHFIGLSTILSIPLFILLFRKQNKFSLSLPLILGIIIMALSGIVEKIHGPLYFSPLGIHPSVFYTLDYEPLLPWFSVILIGITIGFLLYPQGKRRFSLHWKKDSLLNLFKPFSFLGRHSLIIYLIHQPIILGILWLSGIIDLGIF